MIEVLFSKGIGSPMSGSLDSVSDVEDCGNFDLSDCRVCSESAFFPPEASACFAPRVSPSSIRVAEVKYDFEAFWSVDVEVDDDAAVGGADADDDEGCRGV